MRVQEKRARGRRGTERGNRYRASAVLVATAALGVHCAPAIKRDLSNMPAGRVGFDDLCDLQTYFDRLTMKIGTPPEVVSSNEIQGRGQRSGRSRFTFETDFQLRAVREVLTKNWTRLPDDLAGASRIELEVRWSERSGVRRVVTNEDAELTVGRVRTDLPYHVCLSELLFGEPLYRQRRTSLGLAPLPTPTPTPTPTPSAAETPADGGAPVNTKPVAGADAGGRASAAPAPR